MATSREPAYRSDEAGYWEEVGAEWTHGNKDMLWRRHSDYINSSLFARWLGNTTYDRLLKTDLFDEAVTGGVIPAILHGCKWVIGVDLSREIVSMAERRHNITALCADVRTLPFQDQSLDVILSNSTLDHFEHFSDVVRALHEFRRVLRTSGELWITLDNASNPLVAIRNALPFGLVRRLGLVPYYVGATCNRAQFERTFDEAGLEPREIGTVMHCPRVLAVQLTRLAERYGTPALQKRLLGLLAGFERAANWPTRFRTGHFLYARVVKR